MKQLIASTNPSQFRLVLAVDLLGIGERCHVEDDTLVQRLNRGLMPGWYW